MGHAGVHPHHNLERGVESPGFLEMRNSPQHVPMQPRRIKAIENTHDVTPGLIIGGLSGPHLGDVVGELLVRAR